MTACDPLHFCLVTKANKAIFVPTVKLIGVIHEVQEFSTHPDPTGLQYADVAIFIIHIMNDAKSMLL